MVAAGMADETAAAKAITVVDAPNRAAATAAKKAGADFGAKA